MKTYPKGRNFFLTLFLFILAVGTLSCDGELDGRPRAWIDFPRDGTNVPIGNPVKVASHAFARDGVAEVVLSVNGEAYRRDAPVEPGAQFTEVSQEWIPSEAGIYTLQVRVYDTLGEYSNPATISIRVGDLVVVEPIEVDPATHTPTPVISITPTLTFTPVEDVVEPDVVEEPVVEEVATCPPTATALQNANCRSGPGIAYPVTGSLGQGVSSTVVGRNADSSWWVIENPGSSGTCWVWDELVEVKPDTCDVPILAAPPLPPTDTPTPPPTPTFTPTTPPQDTTPPSVPAPQSPANGAAVSCAASVTLSWSASSDDSGIATYYIKLEKQISPGNWQSVGGFTSTTTSVDVPVDCGIIYRWTVRAEDNAGNFSDWSGFSQFGVNLS